MPKKERRDFWQRGYGASASCTRVVKPFERKNCIIKIVSCNTKMKGSRSVQKNAFRSLRKSLKIESRFWFFVRNGGRL